MRFLCATLKVNLFIILLTVISFLFVPSVLAADFNVDAPEEVRLGESFEVSIESTSPESYDVKIFVYRDEKNSYVSQIYYEGVWKSPRLYLKEVFPEEKRYSVRVVNFTGTSEVCVRLRKVRASSYDEVCRSINVIYEEDRLEKQNLQDIEADIQDSEKLSTGATESAKRERIVLRTKEIPAGKEEGDSYYDTTRAYVAYAFVFFCVAIVALIWFKKL